MDCGVGLLPLSPIRFIDHALKPEPPCLESELSSESCFMNIMRARSPPKVLLGLKDVLYGVLGVTGSPSSLRFLKAGSYLFSKPPPKLLVAVLILST